MRAASRAKTGPFRATAHKRAAGPPLAKGEGRGKNGNGAPRALFRRCGQDGMHEFKRKTQPLPFFHAGAMLILWTGHDRRAFHRI
jgi:hypothetical protein